MTALERLRERRNTVDAAITLARGRIGVSGSIPHRAELDRLHRQRDEVDRSIREIELEYQRDGEAA